MKKKLTTLAILCCLCNSITAQFLLDSDTHFFKDSNIYNELKKKSLIELRAEIEKDFFKVKKFLDVFDIRTNEEKRTFKEAKIENLKPFSLASTESIQTKFNNTVQAKQLFHQQHAAIPSIYINPDRGDKFMVSFVDAQYAITKLWCQGGTHTLTSCGLRKVDSLIAIASLRTPVKLSMQLLKLPNKQVQTPYGLIKMDSIVKNSAYFQMPAKAHEKLLEVYAITPTGKRVHSYSAKNSSITNTALQQITNWFKNVLAKIDNNEFKNTEACLLFIENELLTLELFSEKEKDYTCQHIFSANKVMALEFYFADDYLTLQQEVVAYNTETGNGNYVFENQEMYGICDAYGKVLVPPAKDKLSKRSNGLFTKNDTAYYFLNKETNQLQAFKHHGNFYLREVNNMYVLENDVTYETRAAYEKIDTPTYSIDTLGLLNERGDIVLPQTHAGIEVFSNCIAFKKGLHDKYTIATKEGKILHRNFCDKVMAASKEDTSNTLTIVKNGERYGLLDKSGKPIIPFELDNIYDFEYNLAVVATKEKYGIINSKGEKIIAPVYEYLNVLGANAISFSAKNNLMGIMDAQKKIIIPEKYSEINSTGIENLFWARNDNGFGLIDINGAVVMPFTLTDVRNFEGGYAWVHTKTHYGMVDTTGKFVMKKILPSNYGLSRNWRGTETTYEINGVKYNYKGQVIPK
jgi:hypothetical protein